MTATATQPGDSVQFSNYAETKDGFREYLKDLGDELFPFPGYREYQDEILYEALEAYFIDGYRNVIVEGPTGIGKSPLNVAIARVFSKLSKIQREIQGHFPVTFSDLNGNGSFYTTPQKSLRNQLAEDEDLREYVSMLKGRRDYICGETGSNCGDCPVRSSTEESCRTVSSCTYWAEKMSAVEHQIATVTFAMLIVDNYVPVHADDGGRLSFGNRDLVIVDEGHNSEGQSASMFAGFTLSPFSVPPEVYGDSGERANWEDDRFADVQDIISTIATNCRMFIDRHEGDERKQSQVEQCESIKRKIDYAMKTHAEGEGWVVNVNEVAERKGRGTTKKIEIKPVRVDDFLADYVWSRGGHRLITSATIPFRANIDKWANRIGLDGRTKFISKPTPFPESHREIYLNTMVGEMSGQDEDRNWNDAMTQIEEISSYHEGEKGLIHSVSYPRAEEVGDSLGTDNLIVDVQDNESDAMIDRWQKSDKDIMVSPRMSEGVDLHGDLCRWQVLLKTPFAYAGDSRVSYLLNEEYEWDWYFEKAGIDIIQSVGRAVRGPEPEEAASFYIIDEKFEDVMYKTTPPEYFVDAVRDGPPDHWENPNAAPWRDQ
jgi:ATP-dependent DNA helicase DinG